MFGTRRGDRGGNRREMCSGARLVCSPAALLLLVNRHANDSHDAQFLTRKSDAPVLE